MAKATGPTPKSKCPPQSVSASGDPINEYVKSVSKNIKKGKDSKDCKGCNQALNASLGLRSIYKVLGDNKFVEEAKQAEANLKIVSKLTVIKKISGLMKLYGDVIQIISAISAKEGIPLPDLLITIAKRKGMLDNIMDTIQSTLFNFINIVKMVDKEVSLKQAFKIYTISQSFAKTVKTIIAGIISMMILQKFKSFNKTVDMVVGEKGMIAKVLGMYASMAIILSAKITPKKMALNVALIKESMNQIVELTVPFGEGKNGVIVFVDRKGNKNFVNMNVAHNNIEKFNKILKEIIETHTFIRKLGKMAILTTLAIPGLLVSNAMISIAMWSFNKLLNTELITGITKEMGVKLGIGEKFFNLFRKEDKKVKVEKTETEFLEKIKGFQKVLNAMLFAYIKISAVLGTISLIMLAVGGIAGFANLGIAIGMITGTIGLMFMSVIGFSKMFEKSKLTDKKIYNVNKIITLIALSFVAFALGMLALSRISGNINWKNVGITVATMIITTWAFIGTAILLTKFNLTSPRKIQKVSESTQAIAISFLVFAIAIAALSYINISEKTMLGVGLVVSVMSLMLLGFTVLAKTIKQKDMLKMIALTWVSLTMIKTLAAFALVVFGISLIMKNIDGAAWKNIGLTLITMTAMFASFALAAKMIGWGNLGKIALMTIVIHGMNLALLGFTLTLFLVSKLIGNMSINDWNCITLTMITLMTLAAAIALVGKFGKEVAIGSLVVLAISLSMVIFTMTLMFVNKMIGDMGVQGWINIGLMAVSILVLSAMLYFVGKFGEEIAIGALVVVVVSLSLIVYSFAIERILKAVEGKNWSDLAMGGAVIGGMIALLAIAFIVGKMGAENFLIGAAVMIVVSTSLLIYAFAIKKILDATKGVEWADLGKAGVVVLGMLGLAGIAFLIGQPVFASFALLGAVVMISISGALLVFAIAVEKMVSIKFPEAKDIENMGKYVEMLGSKLAPALMEFGLRAIFIMPGIVAMAAAGHALSSMAKGMKEFNGYTEGFDFDKLTVNIAKTIGTISKAFSEIGANNTPDKSLMARVFGASFKKSDVEVGIQSVMQSGKALTSIAKGIKEFDAMTRDIEFGSVDDPDKKSLLYKISSTVGMINMAFADIGKSKDGSKSLMGMIFGNDFSQTDVEKGIVAVQGVGKVFKELAEGLKLWNNLNTMGIDEVKISENIGKVLTMTSEIFAKIGRDTIETEVETGLLNKLFTGRNTIKVTSNAVADGIAAVQGTGGVIKDLAEGLKVWADLDKQGIDISHDGNIAKNIRLMLELTSDIFAGIGQNVKEVEIEESGFFGKRKIKVMNNLVAEGVQAMQGAGSEVVQMANALKIMSEISNPTELAARQKDIASMITAVADVFAKIGAGEALPGGYKINLENVRKGIDAVQGSGAELNSIIDGFMKFKTDKDSGGLNIEAVKSDISRMVSFSAGLFSALVTGEGLEGIPKINLEQIKEGKEAASALTLGITELGKLNDAIQKLKGDNSEGIKTLTSQYKQMLELINSTDIKPERLEQYNVIVHSFERLAWANKGFSNFEKSYDKFEKNLRKTRDGINKINLPKLKAYNEMLNLHVDLAKISRASDVNKMAEGMKNFMKEFVDGLESAIEKSTDAMNKGLGNLNENSKENLQAIRDIMAPLSGNLSVVVKRWEATSDTVMIKPR